VESREETVTIESQEGENVRELRSMMKGGWELKIEKAWATVVGVDRTVHILSANIGSIGDMVGKVGG